MPEAQRQKKQCQVCQTEYIPRSGAHKFCSESCKGKWKYLIGTTTTETQYKTISGNWKRYFQRLCNRSHGRQELSIDDCFELLERQDKRCAISGVELTCTLEKGKRFKTNASLDRINAGGSYTKDNVQLVCSAVNSWRADTDLTEFIWWCKQVTQWQESQE